MAKNKKVDDALRAEFTKDLAEFLAKKYDTDVCHTAAGTLMIPCVDSEGDDRWMKFSVIVPSNADEAEGTDGYNLAAEFKSKRESRAERKAEMERKSAEKSQKAKTKKNAAKT